MTFPIIITSGFSLSDTFYEGTLAEIALYGEGFNGATLHNLTFEGFSKALKVGSGAQSYGLDVDGFTARDGIQSIFVANLSNSTFRHLNLSVLTEGDTYGKNHALYIDQGSHNLNFYDVTLAGGRGQALHIYNEAGWGAGTSDLLFDGITIDAPSISSGPIVLGDYAERITIRNLKATANGAVPVVMLRTTRDVVIEDFEAWGGSSLVASSGAPVSNVVFRNGVYHGSWLGAVEGVTFENVTLGPQEDNPVGLTYIAPVNVMHSTDAAWTDCDVSAHIPVGTTGVVLHIDNLSGLSRAVGFRKKGSTDARVRSLTGFNHIWLHIGVDANRIFEAYSAIAADTPVYLVGYWDSSAVFLLNAVNLAPATKDAWTDVDCSAYAPGATGLFFELDPSGGYTFGIRPKGSNHAVTQQAYYHGCWPMSGCDANQRIEVYQQTGLNNLWLVGYCTTGVTWLANPLDISLGATGTWTDIQLPPGATGAIIQQVASSTEYYYGLRKNGSSENIYKSGRQHTFAVVEADPNGIIERKIANVGVDFYLYGYTSPVTNALLSPAIITRATRYGSELRLFDSTDVFLGVVVGDVEWTPRLDGPDSLSARLPREYLRKDGSTSSRLTEIAAASTLRHGLQRYAIERLEDDKESDIRLICRTAEVLLRSFPSNATNMPFQKTGTPTEIMQALFTGAADLEVINGDFTEWTESGYTQPPWPDDWDRSEIVGANSSTFVRMGVYADGPRTCLGLWGKRVDASTARNGFMRSQPIMAAPAGQYRIRFDAKQTTAFISGSSYVKVHVEWLRGDMTTVSHTDTYNITSSLTSSWQTFYLPTSSTYLTPKNQYFRLVIEYYAAADETFSPPSTSGGIGRWPTATWWGFVDTTSIEAVGVNVDCLWDYAGSMDIRDTAVLHTDQRWIRFGSWTVGPSNIYSTSVGDCIDLIFTGDEITVVFAAGGAGAQAQILVDNQEAVAALDVSAVTSYTVENLDPTAEHILEVVVVAVKVAITQATLTPENIIFVHWQDKTLLDCMNDLLAIVGGEYEPDAENKILYHRATVGKDLTDSNVLELRRGVNLVEFGVDEDRSGLVNELICLGYGEGATRLRTIVRSTSTNGSGQTSDDVYGTLRGYYENPDIRDVVTLQLEGMQRVEETAWPRMGYPARMTDQAANVCAPGDTVRCVYQDIVTTLRITEFTRRSDGSPVSVVVGDRARSLVGALGDTVRGLRKVIRL